MLSISVVIPTYNQEIFLTECLESLKTQDFQDWEAIVVDDGSITQDAASRILEEMNDSRLRLIKHSENRGLAAARNTGFRNARAQYVALLDGDDMFAPKYLRTVYEALKSNDEKDCIFVDLQSFGGSSEIKHYFKEELLSIMEKQWIPGAGVLMKKSLWERAGGYCEDPELRIGNEDWDFWLSAASVGFQSIHIPDPLYFYRRRENSMSVQLTYNDFQTRKFMYKRHKIFFDQYKKGKIFLAAGYYHSSKASWLRGERWRAFRLAIYGYWMDPQNKRLERLLAQVLLPKGLLDYLIQIKTFLKNLLKNG